MPQGAPVKSGSPIVQGIDITSHSMLHLRHVHCAKHEARRWAPDLHKSWDAALLYSSSILRSTRHADELKHITLSMLMVWQSDSSNSRPSTSRITRRWSMRCLLGSTEEVRSYSTQRQSGIWSGGFLRTSWRMGSCRRSWHWHSRVLGKATLLLIISLRLGASVSVVMYMSAFDVVLKDASLTQQDCGTFLILLFCLLPWIRSLYSIIIRQLAF